MFVKIELLVLYKQYLEVFNSVQVNELLPTKCLQIIYT